MLNFGPCYRHCLIPYMVQWIDVLGSCKVNVNKKRRLNCIVVTCVAQNEAFDFISHVLCSQYLANPV